MDIGLSAVFDLDVLRSAWHKVLPGLAVEVIEDISELPDTWDLWVLVVEGSAEFPTALLVAASYRDGCDQERWLRDVARALGDALGARSIVDGTPYGRDDSPYWCLIWDRGVPYLADDSEVDDGETDDEGPIHIVGKLDLEQFPRRSPEELAACVAPARCRSSRDPVAGE